MVSFFASRIEGFPYLEGDQFVEVGVVQYGLEVAVTQPGFCQTCPILSVEGCIIPEGWGTNGLELVP